MAKIDRLIKIAQSRMPPEPPIDFSYATNEELYEMLNGATTKERFHEIVYTIVDRAGKGQLWDRSARMVPPKSAKPIDVSLVQARNTQEPEQPDPMAAFKRLYGGGKDGAD